MPKYVELAPDLREIADGLRSAADQITEKSCRSAYDLTLAQQRNALRLCISDTSALLEDTVTLYREVLSRIGIYGNEDYRQEFLNPRDSLKLEILPWSIVHLKIPGLLPFRTQNYTTYLPAKVRYLLESAKRNEDSGTRLPHFANAAVVFVHGFPEQKGLRRDYDNLERKAIMDILRDYLFFSDNMEHLVSTDIARPGLGFVTNIFVMDMRDYPCFITRFFDQIYG